MVKKKGWNEFQADFCENLESNVDSHMVEKCTEMKTYDIKLGKSAYWPLRIGAPGLRIPKPQYIKQVCPISTLIFLGKMLVGDE